MIEILVIGFTVLVVGLVLFVRSITKYDTKGD